MTPEQRDHFHNVLLNMRHQILDAGDFKAEPNRQDAYETPDADDDQPLNEMNQSIASRRNQVRTGTFVQVEAALRKITQEPEDYGYCEECDDPIPVGRLNIRPYALLCVACQSVKEDPVRGAGRRNLTDFR